MTGKGNSSKTPRNIMARPETICVNFCSYYKPDKAQDLACQGFTIVKRLMQKGWAISLEKRGWPVTHAVSEMLSANLCPLCPFRRDGCDFASGRKEAPPCGGFVLLGNLVESGVLQVDDLRNIV
jgi:hypothetical protein